MSGFSSAIKLADLDDYLAPSQQCVKPMMKPIGAADTAASSSTSSTNNNRGSTIQVELEVDLQAPTVELSAAAPLGANFGQLKVDRVKQTATVSLNDCLACSGCVTSAETVLITQQSVGEFLAQLQAGDVGEPRTIVVSISPQSRASLAHHFGLSALDTARKLTTFLHSLGVRHVCDTTYALDIALIEAEREFIARYRKVNASTGSTAATAGTPLPLFSSECPGWVCYAEKTQGSAIIPHMSTVKSPQQILGTLVKRFWSEKLKLKPNQIYHVTVMPCFDKKLEASRDDFYSQEFSTRDVDCVLTSGELLNLILEQNVEFTQLANVATLDSSFSYLTEDGAKLARPPDSTGSGGYMENIFRAAARELYNVEFPHGPLPIREGRNADLKELSLEVNGKEVLCFAIAYGFRNIQNLMRQIKTRRCKYHYVEIMACPSGCLNGGGQIRPAGSEGRDIKLQKVRLAAVHRAYMDGDAQDGHEQSASSSSPSIAVLPIDAARVAVRLRDVAPDALLTAENEPPASSSWLHTQFRAIEKADVNPLTVRW